MLSKRALKLGALALLFAVLSRGAMFQYTMSKQSVDTYRIDKEKGELFEWINRNTEPGAVVASLNWDMVASLPVKTHGFNFAPIGMRTVASTEESIDRYLWVYALLGATDETVKLAFSDDPSSDQAGIAISRAVYFLYAQPDRIFTVPLEKIEEVLHRYEGIKERFFRSDAPPFRLDFLLISGFEKPIMVTKVVENSFELVFSNQSYSLWKLPHRDPT